uniref:Endonuclease/exonuclease/phosphatase domain-containing protein n=1 Tax=Strigamia maritima TaxID=126957 RepID=T1IQZ8_STRMM
MKNLEINETELESLLDKYEYSDSEGELEARIQLYHAALGTGRPKGNCLFCKKAGHHQRAESKTFDGRDRFHTCGNSPKKDKIHKETLDKTVQNMEATIQNSVQKSMQPTLDQMLAIAKSLVGPSNRREYSKKLIKGITETVQPPESETLIEDMIIDAFKELKVSKNSSSQTGGVCENIDQMIEQLRGKIEVLESYSRRTNLVFKGIQEDTKESWENTEEKVIAAVKLHLDMVPKSIARAHRVGVKGKGPRPIIAKFESEKRKEEFCSTGQSLKVQSKKRIASSPCSSREGGGDEHIRLIVWNVAGLHNKGPLFWEITTEKDIIILSETWLKEKENKKFSKKLDEAFRWDFLPATRCNRKGRAKGQLISIRKRLEWSWTCEKWKYGLVIRYQIASDSGILVSVYCNEGVKRLTEELDPIIEEAEDKGWQVMIKGDFNARIANKQVDLGDKLDVRHSEDNTINDEGKLLLQFCGEHCIKILNGMTDGDWLGKFTSINIRGAAVVDYFITSDESVVIRFEVQESTESDHLPLVIDLFWSVKRKIKMIRAKRNCWSWKKDKGFETMFNRCLESKLVAMDMHFENVDKLIDSVNQILNTTAVEMGLTLTQVINKNQSWFDKDCREEKREVRRALRRFRKTREDEDRISYVNKKQI